MSQRLRVFLGVAGLATAASLGMWFCGGDVDEPSPTTITSGQAPGAPIVVSTPTAPRERLSVSPPPAPTYLIEKDAAPSIEEIVRVPAPAPVPHLPQPPCISCPPPIQPVPVGATP